MTKQYKTIINTDELEQLIQQEMVTIVDCRHVLTDTDWGQREYQESHIPGAYYAHLDHDLSGPILPGQTGRHPLPSDWNRIFEMFGNWGISPDCQVVVYDQSHGGIASRLWWMLKFSGHENVAVLNGGWKKWHEEGREVSKVIPTKHDRVFYGVLQENMVASMDEVQACPQMPDTILIDARAAQRFGGKEEPIDPIAGHIPSAVNYPFLDNLNDDLTWKSPSELTARFQMIYHQLPDDVIVYCGSGVTACHNILGIVMAGFKMPRLYPGAWSEWITRSENEIVLEDGGGLS